MYRDRHPIALTSTEFKLLAYLLRHPRQVFSKEQILQEVWGYDFLGDTRAVDSAIKRLRASLRLVDPRADGIEAVRGLGYKFRREGKHEA